MMDDACCLANITTMKVGVLEEWAANAKRGDRYAELG